MTEEQWSEEALGKLKVTELKALMAKECPDEPVPKRKNDMVAVLLKHHQKSSESTSAEAPTEESAPAPASEATEATEKTAETKEDGPKETEAKSDDKEKEEEEKAEEPPAKKAKTDDVAAEEATEEAQSNTVFIEGFVRPLNLKQVQEMLEEKVGKVTSVWLNSIKTHGFATFESAADAARAIKELHGIHWPESNKATLTVRFSSEEEAAQAKAQEASFDTTVEKANVADLPQSNKASGGASSSPAGSPSESEAESDGESQKRPTEPPVLVPLDEQAAAHFNKTETEPVLYWLPCDGEKF